MYKDQQTSQKRANANCPKVDKNKELLIEQIDFLQKVISDALAA